MAGRLTLLQLGTAKVDITPRVPVPLAGFAGRTGLFDQVLTPLFARILCFQSGAEPPVIFVSADLIWWGSDRVPAMRQRIRAHSGLSDASVILHATHNHSGPQTSESMSPLIGTPSTFYIQALEEAVVRGVREALRSVEPVTAERGSAPCDISIHRRLIVNGQVQMAPNPHGPRDAECTVLRFQTLQGVARAVLVHFACHPTTTAENSVSAEFCGAAMTVIERELGKGVLAAYLQGCCGDVRPALIQDEQFYRGGDDDVRRLGVKLAAVAQSVLAGPMEACEPPACSSKCMELPLFFDTGEPESTTMAMTLLRLAPNLGFLTFNAETVVEYGLYVKRHSGGSILPMGYTNGMIGYVTTEQQLIEGGYESREAFRYFGMPGPFQPTTEQRILDAVDTLLR